MTFERSGVVYVVDPASPEGRRVATIKEFFEHHARKRGMTYEEVVGECYRQAKGIAMKREWGPMLEEYDPSRDEDHPARGWEK